MNKLYYYIRDKNTEFLWKLSKYDNFFFFDENLGLIKSGHSQKTIDQLKLILEYND